MIRVVLCSLALFVGSVSIGASSTVSAAEVVHYELKEWKAKHIHDVKKVETIEKTFKQLKVETKRAQHNGHIDLQYRCPKKMMLPVKSHEEAMKWEKWFKEYGFKVYHTH